MTDHTAKPERRLAAIMATDVVGYSKLMQSDEARALAALTAVREITHDQIKQHRGRIANTAGDSVVVEFGSAVEAVSCAISLQEALAHQGAPNGGVQIRIGVHCGDVVDKGGDLFGTAVNVAARLEGIAQPGGIVVSSAVREDVAGKLPATFADLGLKTLKNIELSLRVYSVVAAGGGPMSAEIPRTGEFLPLPDKPSIAVLAFDNLSGDADQDYFADGMVEEIITALSRMRWLFVIARNSSFTYKGRAVDVKQIGRELGVRYLLEGSVRKAGSRVRITGQLIDTSTGAHLWADRFDGGLDDIFDLQDQVTASVVGAIAPKLEQAEIDRATRKPTDSLDAYDYFLRGLASYNEWTREANKEALSSFYRAIELDPNFAAVYGMAAHCYGQSKQNGWMTDPARDITETARLIRRASELGKDDAVALCAAGIELAYVVGDLDDGAGLIDRALLLNPNMAAAWKESGWIRLYQGDPETAIERFSRAMRLSPHDPEIFYIQTGLGGAHFIAGRYIEALSWAETAVRREPNFNPALRLLAASSAMAGRQEQAQRAITRLLERDPELHVSKLRE